MKRLILEIAAGLAVLVLAGCASFDPMQTSLFTDENGNIVSVDYGRSKKDHESKFTAPSGKVMTMKSKLAVRVTLPDGTDFVAWECMNPLPSGTMYRTNNEKWMYHANGITCQVFSKALNPEGKDDYLLVFEGMICEGPKKGESL
jgi:hypothetical protein